MKGPKSIAEWLESHGNPRHFIYTDKEGDGTSVIVVEDNDSLGNGITVYSFMETDYGNGEKYFWMSSGWGLRKDLLPAVKGFLNLEEGEHDGHND